MKRFFTLFMVVLVCAALSCNDNGDDAANDVTRPSFGIVESDEASDSGVWLHAEYTCEGEVTDAGFAYKLRRSQDDYVSVQADSWDQKGMQLQLSGLQPESEYMYYSYVVVSGARFNSTAMTFTTAPEGVQPETTPHFSTPEASECTQEGALLACEYTYRGENSPSEAGFFYREGTSGEWSKIAAAKSDSPLRCEVGGLQPATAYTFCAFVTVDGTEYRSEEGRFSTLDEEQKPQPVLSKPVAEDVTATSTSVSATLSYEGDETISEVGFRYKSASASTYSKVTVTAAAGTARATLSGLTPSTAYSLLFYAVVGGAESRSEEVTFTTSAQSSGGGSEAKFSGWPELLAEDDSNSDYYYAYHLCPDVYVPGTGNSRKRRNFSVCYSNELKCAIWVAAPMHDCYLGSADRTDAYKSDPDIPVSQPGKWSGYTRGHMLGSGERTCTSSVNRQVFYYSNIAPQFGQPYFNTGGGAWNTLEGWVDTQWQGYADTTYQVIGSYWKNHNTVVSGTTVPTHYYKVLLRTKNHRNKWVVECSRDELQCIAIMIEHRTYSKGEVPQPSQYESKGLLLSVSELEQMTGLTFFPNVPNAPKDTYNPSDWGL